MTEIEELEKIPFKYKVKLKDGKIKKGSFDAYNLEQAKNYLINKDLQYKTKNNIKSKSLINTYKGFRLKNKLPCHGQNTHSNGKTAKKN